jgi:flagellar M-ring protein FliF
MRISEFGVLSVLALIAMFFVFRPMLSRIAASAGMSRGAQAAIGGHSQDGGNAALPAPDGTISGDDISAALMGTDQKFGDDAMIDIAQVAGKVKGSSVRKIGELVAVHPDESISILRSWLHEAV